jgi:DNA-binding MarR family transcriptional regulator
VVRPTATVRGARRVIVSLTVIGLAVIASVHAYAQATARPSLDVPRLARQPSCDDFLDMQPGGDAERQMVRVSDCVQQEPSDGLPSSQRTGFATDLFGRSSIGR